MSLKIGNYTIETQEAYDLLQKNGITSNDHLSQLDKNKDMKISEDELVEVREQLEEAEEEEKKDDKTEEKKSSGQTTEEKIATYEQKVASYETQVISLYKQMDTLQEKRNRVYNKLSKAGDLETYNSVLSEADSIKGQLSNIRTQIYNCYYNIEQATEMINKLKETQAAMDEASDNNTGSLSTNSSGGQNLSLGTSGSTKDTGTVQNGAGTSSEYKYSRDNAKFVSNFNNSSFKKGVLAGKGALIASVAEKYGIDPNLLASIIALETGWGTSNAIKSYNNPGGMMDPNSGWMKLQHYSSLEEGIEAVARNLKNGYIDKGLVTIRSIGAKYCPEGAANDPNGTNSGWVPSVTTIYNQLAGVSITADTKLV